MGDKTGVEWADATWNPVTGCSKISPACDHCYAERMSKRLRGRCGYPADDPFRVTLHPNRLDQPLRWRKPRRIFVCSMGDLFHDDVPFEYIAAVFGAMSSASQHTFLVLTKRPHRMREWYRWIARDECAPGLRIRKESYRARHRCAVAWARYGGDVTSPWVTAESLVRTEAPSSGHWPIHVWLGVTAEDQKRADERIPILLQIPAALHWVSIEPCLGPVDISQWASIRFLVVGGESGPGARPCHPGWVRSLRDQCIDAGVPFLFKGWGAWCHEDQLPESTWVDLDRAGLLPPPNLSDFCCVGKKAAGRELDGKVWDQYPEGIVK